MPAFALLTLFVFRPRQLLRWRRTGIAALVFAVAMAPGMFGALEEFGQADSQTSTAGAPPITRRSSPMSSRIHWSGGATATLDSIRVDETRILDNEYLGQLWQVGGLGLLAFLAMIRDAARRDPHGLPLG